MRLGLVFIGFCTGCYRKTRDPLIITERSVQTTETPKVLKEFSKHDYCYDYKNHTKIYTGNEIESKLISKL